MAATHRSVAQVIDKVHSTADAVSAAETSDKAALLVAGRRILSFVHDLLMAGEYKDQQDRDVIADFAALAGGALPENPFRWLLGEVAERSAHVYGDAWIDPRLELRSWDRHPRPVAPLDPYPVGGAKRGREDSVVLRMWVPGFGPGAYCALLRLLAHECVCHVAARQRGVVKNTSTFAEGYMDWVTGYFVTRWLPQIDPSLAIAAEFHGDSFMAVLAEATTDESEARRVGTDAASELAVCFQVDAGLTYESAHAAVAALGVELNLVDERIERKDHFVSRLQPHVDETIVEGLLAWLRGDIGGAELI
jgi:hypothetical protein